jgi:hypothetical protein
VSPDLFVSKAMTQMLRVYRVVLLLIGTIAMLIATNATSQAVRAGEVTTPPAPPSRGQEQRLILPRLLPGYFFLSEDVHSAGVSGIAKQDLERRLQRTPRGVAAWASLDRANAEWSKGNRPAALKLWNALIAKDGRTEAAYAAQRNLAQAVRLSGDRLGSIKAYVALVSFPPPNDGELGGDILCANERHDACLELSDMCLESGELASAAKYAELALTTHVHYDICGVWASAHEEQIKGRIQAIKDARASSHSLGVEPRDEDLSCWERAWEFVARLSATRPRD